MDVGLKRLLAEYSDRACHVLTSHPVVCAAVLQNCAMADLSKIKNCQQIDSSMCDTKPSCDTEVSGIAFSDHTCFLVANNDKKLSAQFNVQVWQYYDCECV